MAYQSWSVVFGEQPSAAKWNILGSNDASFNDGTGIGTGVITTAKIADDDVTSEKLQTTIAFHAYRNASQSISSSLTTVIFDTERYDLGADYNTTTGQFTAPRNGIYSFSAGLNCSASAQTRVVIQFVCSSAGDRIVFDATATDINKANGAIEIDLNASETVEVKVLQLTNANVAGIETFFAGAYIGSE